MRWIAGIYMACVAGVAGVVAVAGAAMANGPTTYKWVDKDGRVQYSDKAPIGQSAQSMNSRATARPADAGKGTGGAAPGTSASTTGGTTGGTTAGTAAGVLAATAAAKSAAPLSVAEQEQAFRRRRLEAEENAQKQAKADEANRQKLAACSEAKGRLAGLDVGGRHRRVNERGEAVFLDDAQIEQEKSRARTEIGSACG